MLGGNAAHVPADRAPTITAAILSPRVRKVCATASIVVERDGQSGIAEASGDTGRVGESESGDSRTSLDEKRNRRGRDSSR